VLVFLCLHMKGLQKGHLRHLRKYLIDMRILIFLIILCREMSFILHYFYVSFRLTLCLVLLFFLLLLFFYVLHYSFYLMAKIILRSNQNREFIMAGGEKEKGWNQTLNIVLFCCWVKDCGDNLPLDLSNFTENLV
jgi:hypothetical protein